MLRASLLFFVLALVSFIFGATGVAGLSIEIGKMLLWVFLAMAAISFIISLFTGRSVRLLE